MLVWIDDLALRALHLDASGGASAPDIAWDGAQLGVAFVHGGVQLFLLDGALAARPDRSVTIRGGAGGTPTLAAREGGGFLVVWAEDRPAS